MSTKCTLYFDDKIHVYQECFDENSVHIKSDASNPVFKYSLSLQQACGLAQAIDLESLRRQAFLNDVEIRQHCRDFVLTRVNSDNAFSQMAGMFVYGEVKDPVELQIERGVKYYTERRDALKKVYDSLFNSPRKYGTRFQFGLEEII